jgi:membrane fusion protein
LAEQQTHWLGTVLLAPRISHTLFTAFAGLVIASLLVLVFLGDFTRKARINGWLVPDAGLVRLFAPQLGRIAQLHVHEGTEVLRGDPLVLLSTEVESEALGATRQQIVDQLVGRRNSMRLERERQNRVFANLAEELSDRMATVEAEAGHLEQELDLQRERLLLAEQAVARRRQLRASGLVTEQALQEEEANKLDQALRLQALERGAITTERERLRLEAEIRALPLKQETQIAEIDRGIASLEQEIAEAESRREILITAPQAGTVTAIQGAAGGTVNTAAPLLSIVPEGSKLEAELFSPSRAIGFLRPGQQVLLRYQAFPYQKFGTYEGRVTSISRSAMSPSELLPQISGLMSPGGTNEPVYRITVSLAQQTAVAYGEPVALQAGMQLEADVLIERRRLIEWILDPVFTLTGKWGR